MLTSIFVHSTKSAWTSLFLCLNEANAYADIQPLTFTAVAAHTSPNSTPARLLVKILGSYRRLRKCCGQLVILVQHLLQDVVHLRRQPQCGWHGSD